MREVLDTLFKDRDEFERLLDAAAREADLRLPTPARKAILSALSERDETAAICRDRDGNPEADPELRDTESVPLPAGEDPADGGGVPESVRAFAARGGTVPAFCAPQPVPKRRGLRASPDRSSCESVDINA